MKLYMVPLAPNPTKVMLYIAERAARGTAMGIEQVLVSTRLSHHRNPAHLARNPFGTLPVLELDDGSHLLESRVIIEYLEERFPDTALTLGDARARACARDVERIVELRLARPLYAYVHATNSPLGLPPDPAQAQRLHEKVQPALDYLETLLSDGRALLTGASVGVADCTLQAALQFMRFARADVLGERPALRAWDGRYWMRKSATDVLKW